MGEAKRRGSFEQRAAEAMERERLAEIERQREEAQRRKERAERERVRKFMLAKQRIEERHLRKDAKRFPPRTQRLHSWMGPATIALLLGMASAPPSRGDKP